MTTEQVTKPSDVNQEGSVTPAKRGRGRPPKPKSAGGEVAATKTPVPGRGRGRPPKQKDPLAVKATPPKSSGRGRGRPPKEKKAEKAEADEEAEDDDDEDDETTTTTVVAPVTGASPKPRGRPPKAKTVAAVGAD